jgi:serine/threonine protein kinase
VLVDVTRGGCAASQVTIMAALDHQNVVKYYDSFLEGNLLNIVMEFCEEGDLQMFLKKCAQRRILPPENVIWNFFIQIAVALHYLHGKRILHRDIKSANIFMSRVRVKRLWTVCCAVAAALPLLSSFCVRFSLSLPLPSSVDVSVSVSVVVSVSIPPSPHVSLPISLPCPHVYLLARVRVCVCVQGNVVKIGDLGVAKVLGTNTGFARTCVGTPYYLSPELCEDKPYNDVRVAADLVAASCCVSRSRALCSRGV